MVLGLMALLAALGSGILVAARVIVYMFAENHTKGDIISWLFKNYPNTVFIFSATVIFTSVLTCACIINSLPRTKRGWIALGIFMFIIFVSYLSVYYGWIAHLSNIYYYTPLSHSSHTS
jgi:uncharacterized membrane protein